MPQVITGYEPTDSGWTLVTEQVFNQDPPGTPAIAGYSDFRLLSTNIPGLGQRSLLGNVVSMQDIFDQVTSQGFRVYYIAGWNQPPGFIIGIDNYRIIWVRRA